MSDGAFYESESKFYDCNSQISHHNEFSIKCPPNPHWLMDEPLKPKVPSKIYGSSHISEETNAVSHQEPQERKTGPFAWTLFESQITNEDPSSALSNVLFILTMATVTDTLAGFEGKAENLMKALECA